MKSYTIWIKRTDKEEEDPRRIEIRSQFNSISRVLLSTWNNIGRHEEVVGIISNDDVCLDDII